MGRGGEQSVVLSGRSPSLDWSCRVNMRKHWFCSLWIEVLLLACLQHFPWINHQLPACWGKRLWEAAGQDKEHRKCKEKTFDPLSLLTPMQVGQLFWGSCSVGSPGGDTAMPTLVSPCASWTTCLSRPGASPDGTTFLIPMSHLFHLSIYGYFSWVLLYLAPVLWNYLNSVIFRVKEDCLDRLAKQGSEDHQEERAFQGALAIQDPKDSRLVVMALIRADCRLLRLERVWIHRTEQQGDPWESVYREAHIQLEHYSGREIRTDTKQGTRLPKLPQLNYTCLAILYKTLCWQFSGWKVVTNTTIYHFVIDHRSISQIILSLWHK